MKPRIVAYKPLPDDVLAYLREHADVVQADGAAALGDALAHADGAIGASLKIPPAMLDRAPRLKAWSTISVGYDNLDVPDLTRRALECASLRVGLALAAFLETAARLPADTVRVKWPNDLMARDRKLGGILCEARWQGEEPAWMVIGVGLNVANPLATDLRLAAVRLADLAPPPDLETLADGASRAVLRAIGVEGPFDAAELAGFAERDWLAGRRIESPVAGVARGIDSAGRLRIDAPGGEQVLLVGPVVLAPLAGTGGSH